jgi:hypothetical protein
MCAIFVDKRVFPERTYNLTVTAVPGRITVSESNYKSESHTTATQTYRPGTSILNKDENEYSNHGENDSFTTDTKEETLCNSTILKPNLDMFNRSKSVEKRHIAFLKVHKAASTTLQTMFYRFGFERNLSFVLPIKSNYISKSVNVHEDLVSPLHGDHYDIICNHGIFSHFIYSSLMPNDTIYLAVVRNPVDQFISAVKYYTEVYKFQYLVNIPGNRINNLINFPNKYDELLSYTRNSMSRDFGFQKHHVFNMQEAECYLMELDKVFDFVLIAEHFDESLILMRRRLNWSLKDILYISKNVRGQDEVISKPLKAKLYERNKLDYMVYDFFYRKFQIILKEFKEDVMAEMVYFKQVLSTVQSWCVDDMVGNLMIKSSVWNDEFTINMRDCKLMMKGELKFIKLLKNGITEL